MRLRLVPLMLFSLVACQPEQTQQPAAGIGSNDAPVAADGAEASADSPRVEARRSDQYELRIVQPEINPEHRSLLREVTLYAARMRDEFLGQVEAAKAEGFAFELPWQLELELQRVVDSERLVAVEATGYQFQGGAHGLPLQATFVYLIPTAQVMQIQDWFADEAVWTAISAAAIKALQLELAPLAGEHDDLSEEQLEESATQWLSEGAGPDPQNFQQYLPLLDEAGMIRALQLHFAPYQVAPYAAGSPQVEIPSSILRPYLKPDLAAYFQP